MKDWIHRLWPKRRLVLRLDREPEVDEELRLHIELLEAEYRVAGMDSEDAHAAARRQFGNVTRIAEQSRELFSFRLMDDFLRDVAIGLRSIRRSKGFALVAVSALTIGVGANIVVFGFVNALLLRPLDVVGPERLIRGYSEGSDARAFVDYRDYLRYRDENRTLSS